MELNENFGNSSNIPWSIINENNCTDGMRVFWIVLHECVVDTRGLIAVICGILSILSWVVYALPQMIMNCRKGIQDEAISPWLLIFWTVGDTTNMVGAILTKQLMLQIVMAGYSIVCDLILVAQYTFAVLKHKWKILEKGPQEIFSEGGNDFIDSISVNTTSNGLLRPTRKISPAVTTGSASLLCVTLFMWVNFISVESSQKSSIVGRTLLSDIIPEPQPFLNGYKEIIGYILGCMSSIFYCSGRLPQIYRNFTRKCTVGLSFGLFLFALMGNGTYGAQILITSLERTFILRHLPWIIGSWGVMILDSTILLQCFIYRKNPPHPYSTLLSSSEESSDDELLQ